MGLAKQIKEWGYITDEVLKSLIGERRYNEYIISNSNFDDIILVNENDSSSDEYTEVLEVYDWRIIYYNKKLK